MEPLSRAEIIEFLNRLGERFPFRSSFYLLGGSALCLLGSPRQTVDIDYTTDLNSKNQIEIEQIIHQLASQLNLDVESVPIGEFIPLPPDAGSRRVPVGQFGNLEVFIFDLYSIALSKIARGFDADIEDVLFLLKQKLISFGLLEQYFQEILPKAQVADIDQKEFAKYFQELRHRWIF